MSVRTIGFDLGGATGSESETWTCGRCGNQNPREYTKCLSCGARALEAAEGPAAIGDWELSRKDFQTLQFAPLWIFSAIAQADEKVDQKEVGAVLGILRSSQLIKDPSARKVFGSVVRNLDRVWTDYIRDRRSPKQAFADLRRILDGHPEPGSARRFKLYLLFLARQVAEASGGFLGLGEKTSPQEKTALAAITFALGLTPDDLLED